MANGQPAPDAIRPRGEALVAGTDDGTPDITAGFYPRITPRGWLATSAGESPGATLGGLAASTKELLGLARVRLAQGRDGVRQQTISPSSPWEDSEEARMATSISFFVDPACPWVWVTSRWITEVAPQRDLTIRWRSFSPEIRDGGVRLAPVIPEHLRQVALERRRIGAVASRAFEWLRSEVGEPAVGRFYTELGYRLNDPERPGSPPMPGIIAASLKAADLGQAAEAAASDPIWQRRGAGSTEEAMALVGRDAMTPVIALETGPPAALSGPIVSPASAGADAVRLWDAFAVLLQSPAFFEARRARSLPRFPRPVESR
jgi:hypothetical protein